MTDEKNHRKVVGRRLQAIRELQGWDREQVALMADLKESTIEKIEAGAFNVPLDVLARVADVLGCDIQIRSRL